MNHYIDAEVTDNSGQGLEEFLREIQMLDQSDPSHLQAYDCFERLLEREKEFQDTPLEDMYWDSLSREALHIAQIEAGTKNNHAVALDYIRQAIAHASRVQSGFYSFDWIEYLRGTEAYLLADTRKLETILSGCDANRRILEKLLQGLTQTGKPNYVRDYFDLDELSSS